jgi:hypothetical protein
MILAPGIASACRSSTARETSRDETEGNLANLDTMAWQTRTMRMLEWLAGVTGRFTQALCETNPQTRAAGRPGEPCGQCGCDRLHPTTVVYCRLPVLVPSSEVRKKPNRPRLLARPWLARRHASASETHRPIRSEVPPAKDHAGATEASGSRAMLLQACPAHPHCAVVAAAP